MHADAAETATANSYITDFTGFDGETHRYCDCKVFWNCDSAIVDYGPFSTATLSKQVFAKRLAVAVAVSVEP